MTKEHQIRYSILLVFGEMQMTRRMGSCRAGIMRDPGEVGRSVSLTERMSDENMIILTHQQAPVAHLQRDSVSAPPSTFPTTTLVYIRITAIASNPASLPLPLSATIQSQPAARVGLRGQVMSVLPLKFLDGSHFTQNKSQDLHSGLGTRV